MRKIWKLKTICVKSDRKLILKIVWILFSIEINYQKKGGKILKLKRICKKCPKTNFKIPNIKYERSY